MTFDRVMDFIHSIADIKEQSVEINRLRQKLASKTLLIEELEKHLCAEHKLSLNCESKYEELKIR